MISPMFLFFLVISAAKSRDRKQGMYAHTHAKSPVRIPSGLNHEKGVPHWNCAPSCYVRSIGMLRERSDIWCENKPQTGGEVKSDHF